MHKTQSLPLIQCKICDQWKSFFSNMPNKLCQKQFLNEKAWENKAVTCLLECFFVNWGGKKSKWTKAYCRLYMFCGLLLGKLLMQMPYIALEHCWINQEPTHHSLWAITFECLSYMQSVVFDNSMPIFTCIYCFKCIYKTKWNMEIVNSPTPQHKCLRWTERTLLNYIINKRCCSFWA